MLHLHIMVKIRKWTKNLICLSLVVSLGGCQPHEAGWAALGALGGSIGTIVVLGCLGSASASRS